MDFSMTCTSRMIIFSTTFGCSEWGESDSAPTLAVGVREGEGAMTMRVFSDLKSDARLGSLKASLGSLISGNSICGRLSDNRGTFHLVLKANLEAVLLAREIQASSLSLTRKSRSENPCLAPGSGESEARSK